MESVISEHIEVTPGTCGGKPRIAGHRIRVQDVAIWYEQLGMSPSEIVGTYPTITLADVHAALAYYYDNQELIRRQMADEEAFVAEMMSQSPSRLQEKIAERNASVDPLSPG
jgi:uncharacterized protein (DUF433 family)